MGETGQFQGEFRGVPTPRPTWLVSGTEITETNKYHIEIAECATRLSVSDVTSDDANVAYTCQLTSAAGQATSTARFVIQGKPPLISICIHVRNSSLCCLYCRSIRLFWFSINQVSILVRQTSWNMDWLHKRNADVATNLVLIMLWNSILYLIICTLGCFFANIFCV